MVDRCMQALMVHACWKRENFKSEMKFLELTECNTETKRFKGRERAPRVFKSDLKVIGTVVWLIF